MVVQFIVFLTLSTLICRSTDISNCFSESLGIRDNESRLYMRTDTIYELTCVNYELTLLEYKLTASGYQITWVQFDFIAKWPVTIYRPLQTM